MTTKSKRIKLGHPNKFKGQTEAFGDSDRGIRYFAKKGCSRVDGNALLSLDGLPVNAHWPFFLRRGWVRCDGKREDKSLGIDRWLAKDLRTKFQTRLHHYKMDLSIKRIELAFSLGMDYEFEIKTKMGKAIAQTLHDQVTWLQKQYPKRKVIVKVYNNRFNKGMWLKPWHEVGFPTLITTHTPFRATPGAAQAYADEYRGFKPRWD